MGTIRAIKLNAPDYGGRFALWGGCFSATNCFLEATRKKEDAYNKIASGAITGGVLAARMGPRVAFSSAVVGGVLLAVIEGFGDWPSLNTNTLICSRTTSEFCLFSPVGGLNGLVKPPAAPPGPNDIPNMPERS